MGQLSIENLDIGGAGMPEKVKETYCIRSVENALSLLEAISEEGDNVSLSRLSERVGLTKATVFRLLATFESRGYVERMQGSRDYRLGLSAFEIGQKLLSRMELLRKSRSTMEKLARECNEAIYLVVRRHDDALFMDMVDNSHQVKIVNLVGRKFPLGGCAAGKVFMAFGGIVSRARGRARGSLGVSIGLSSEVAEKIRQEGWCVDHAGVGEGTVSLAVPLFTARGDVSGALTLVGPDFRVTEGKIKGQHLPALRLAGEMISSKLGYVGYLLGEKVSVAEKA